MANMNAYITNMVNVYGYLGLFLGLVVEGTGMPGPVQIFFFAAGYLIFQGKMSFLTAWLVTAIGNLVGNLVGYLIACFGGRPLIGSICRFFGKSLDGIDNYSEKFSKKGSSIVFWGRLFGPIRTPAIIAAGLLKYNLLEYTIFSALGATIWSLFWLWLGLKTAQGVDVLKKIVPNTDYLIWGAIVLCILSLTGWHYFQKWRSQKKAAAQADKHSETEEAKSN